MLFIVAAISLGFLGSFHCVGMCGPIALALPVGKAKGYQKIIKILSYNLGRILTYSLFGFIFGTIGKTVAIFGYQQWLSVSLGLLILVIVLLPNNLGSRIANQKIFQFFNSIKNQLALLFQKEEKSSLFFIGLLNGLLPCGLVYMAVAGAIATSGSLQGALFMACFGLGTAPAMIALPLVGNYISISFRNKIRKSIPIMMGFMAVLLILRGLNLGIPYVSPKLNHSKTPLPTCHTIEGKKVCSHNN